MDLKEWMGIDVGTSGIKVVIIDERANVIRSAYRSYDVRLTDDGGAEQSPELWWQCFLNCVNELDCANVSAIGLTGQMHGLVALDINNNPVCDAILWNDSRSVVQANKIDYWLSHHPNGVLNRPAGGFLLSSLLWLKETKPEMFKKIYRVMLPKDYLRFRLTGVFCTDCGDASGTAAYNILANAWETELLKSFGISEELFPPILHAEDLAGRTCGAFGTLPAGIPVSCGSGDHAMQLVGNGVFDCGDMSCNLGTAGQLSIMLDKPQTDLRANLFCHALVGKYNLVGASLNGGNVLKWLTQIILPGCSYSELGHLAEEAPIGSDGVVLLPYLNGERVPYRNQILRASFHGLWIGHTQAHLVRAAMEGVVFNLRDILEIFRTVSGTLPVKLIASGGGARSRIWLQMQADILQTEIYVSKVKEQAALGAASIAGIASGQIERDEISQTLRGYVQFAAEPDNRSMIHYNDCYSRYCEIRSLCDELYKL